MFEDGGEGWSIFCQRMGLVSEGGGAVAQKRGRTRLGREDHFYQFFCFVGEFDTSRPFVAVVLDFSEENANARTMVS